MKRLLNTAYAVRFWLTSILWASSFMMVVLLSEMDDTIELSQAFHAWIAVALSRLSPCPKLSTRL
jgi:hypothetical protein